MSEHHATGTVVPLLDQLLDELEELATQLEQPGAHFNVIRSSGGWEVVVFIQPVEDPEVRIGLTASGRYGTISSTGTTLADALATAVRICESVAAAQGVPA